MLVTWHSWSLAVKIEKVAAVDWPPQKESTKLRLTTKENDTWHKF